MKRIRVHRRRGAIFRRQRNKCQYRYHRVTQKLHIIAFITYNTKSRLYFYSNKDGSGSLNRTTFIHLIKDHIITGPAWRWDKCLFLDNDQAHGTRGRVDNKVKSSYVKLASVSVHIRQRHRNCRLLNEFGAL